MIVLMILAAIGVMSLVIGLSVLVLALFGYKLKLTVGVDDEPPSKAP